ncbi:MAG TPA: urease accessory protein UreD [Burkholderiaceae bacterium]|jgi:urease accessory protein
MKLSAEDLINGLPSSTPAKKDCQARLSLGFADDVGTTRLIERTHFGPLRVQKPLYPEGPEVCHTIVVHPPGGVVGGDELTINAHIGTQACAFITTPGAAKWYKAHGHVSRQDIQLDIADHASLEWLPQETIFFDESHVQLNNEISLGKDATYIGCEILCFGRTASGESFKSGKITQRNAIRREGKLIWFEQGAILGGTTSMTSPLALAGNTVCATLIAVGKTLPPSLINMMREAAATVTNQIEAFGVTQMKSVVVVRYLGNSSEVARQLITQAWQQLRPELLGREGVVPRIWNT